MCAEYSIPSDGDPGVISVRRSRSVVWRVGDMIYKAAPKTSVDNEFFFLRALSGTGYVPAPVSRVGVELISMPYIHTGSVTDVEAFMSHLEPVLDALKDAGCRHGDLTTASVLVFRNMPVIIDFSESRWAWSPLPDKRREGDRYWLEKTMRTLAGAI